jgi:hypothetical protein
MKKQTSLLLTALVASLGVGGCFGSDPNQNSQVANADAASGAGGTSGNVADASAPINGTALSTFDTGLSGFILNMYKDSGSQLDLGDPNSGVTPVMSFDATEGSPSPGSIQVVAPFFGASQYVDIQNTTMFGTTKPQNWTGGTLHVRIKVLSGTFAGGVQLYVDTGSTYSFGGTYTNFGKSSDWQEFVLSVDSPMSFGVMATYDSKSVIAYGLQLNTGSASANAKSVTFAIDSFSIAGVAPSTGAGGSGGAAGGAGGAGGSSGTGGSGGTGAAGSHGDASVGG